jgi:hypothetical protein
MTSTCAPAHAHAPGSHPQHSQHRLVRRHCGTENAGWLVTHQYGSVPCTRIDTEAFGVAAAQAYNEEAHEPAHSQARGNPAGAMMKRHIHASTRPTPWSLEAGRAWRERWMMHDAGDGDGHDAARCIETKV